MLAIMVGSPMSSPMETNYKGHMGMKALEVTIWELCFSS